MDKKSKRQLNAQQSSAYYGARSIGTLAPEGMDDLQDIAEIHKVHKDFPKHPQIPSNPMDKSFLRPFVKFPNEK